MPRRFCRACKAPLHAADTHSECISCLGLETECPHCGDMSLSSLRSRIAFFSQRDSAPSALPFPPSQEPVKKKQRGRGSQRSELGKLTSAQPPRASPSPQREGSPVLFTRPDIDLVSFGWSEDDMLDSMSLAGSDAEELSGSINDPAPLPSTDTSDPRTRTGIDAELFRVLTRAVDKLGLEWSPPEEPPRSLLDEWFLPGRHQAPLQRASPFLPEVHEELTRSWRAPYSARLRTSSSSALISVDGAEDKGYEKLPPLDESVAAHLCPPTAIGWKAKASHPSKPCRTTSALAGRAYTATLHGNSPSSDKSALDPATMTELRSATDLALRATKATAQAIGRSMASLVVLERHLWLTLTEIKDADKVPFLDAPISPTGLFGPSVEGFAERFSAAQKTSQAMQHFLPTSEVLILLEKGAIEVVHPAQSESGFYSRYFLVPKKDGGLRPILDLRHLNRALMKRPFKMLTLKQILSHVRPGDWFLSLDLKDAYFHIQIAPHHTILEIRLRGCGLSIHGPALQLIPGSPHVYKVHGRGSCPSETEGNPRPQLPRRLARSGPVRGRAVISQSSSPQPLRVPRTQSQSDQERAAPQPTNLVSGSNFRFDSVESYGRARASSGNTATSGLIQGRSPLPPQEVSKDARPYGFCIPSARIGPAAYAAPSALAETTGSTSCMASRTFACQGGPGLCGSPGPLEKPTMVGEGRALGVGLQKEGGHDRCLQQRLGGAV
ncbi:hypothetical protein M9458_056824 [Cirrhinus mrigala]|uniref:Reverse transcriptase domain-containing protein n=1 Tax=Cirrhinus mrigala TaxID=683832 RepID=A0ABD0ME25_CIRMR